MTQRLFHLLDQVQDRWPLGASLQCVQPSTPPAWAIESARTVVTAWSVVEQRSYRAQLTSLATYLSILHQRWVVAASLALALAFTVIAAAVTNGALTEVSSGVLLAIVTAILLPPVTICSGIARDYVAAQALLTVCGSVTTAEIRR